MTQKSKVFLTGIQVIRANSILMVNIHKLCCQRLSQSLKSLNLVLQIKDLPSEYIVSRLDDYYACMPSHIQCFISHKTHNVLCNYFQIIFPTL